MSSAATTPAALGLPGDDWHDYLSRAVFDVARLADELATAAGVTDRTIGHDAARLADQLYSLVALWVTVEHEAESADV